MAMSEGDMETMAAREARRSAANTRAGAVGIRVFLEGAWGLRRLGGIMTFPENGSS